MLMELVWFCLFCVATFFVFFYRAIAVASEKEVNRLTQENFRLTLGRTHERKDPNFKG